MFQIYVAAALMEYYCSKDKNVAFRIFELGLKKFSNSPQYILCYVDYLSHLNGGFCTFEYLLGIPADFKFTKGCEIHPRSHIIGSSELSEV